MARIEVGYVVGKEETNPISVWFPSKGGFNKLGITRGFGSNTGNMSLLDLANMRMNAEKCYLTTELSAQGPYIYDDTNGLATKEDNTPYLNFENAKNVKNSPTSLNKYSSPGDNTYLQSPHTNPAANWLETYYPQQVGGAETVNYDNAPGGNYCTLGIGTKVLVIFPDNTSYGYIIRQIPYDGEMSAVIKNLNED